MKQNKIFTLIYTSVFSITSIFITSCDNIPISPCINKSGEIVLGSKSDDIDVSIESKGVSSSLSLTATAKRVKNENCKEIISIPPNFSYKWKTDSGQLSSDSGSTVSWSGKGKAIITVSVLINGEFKKDSTITVDGENIVNDSVSSSSPKPINNSPSLIDNISPVKTKTDYTPAKISFTKLEIKEQDGNGDNVANRGEKITIKSYFTNSGGANSNQLNIVATSTSEFVTISNVSYDYLSILKPTESKSATYGFTLEISKTTPAGTEIPLSYKLSDNFGNEYSTTGSFIVR